jgi:predicted deacylase
MFAGIDWGPNYRQADRFHEANHMRTCLIGALFPVLLIAACNRTSAQAPFVIGGVSARAGTTAAGTLDVPARGGDSGTTIPFTIIRGRANGPVLALFAGTHGAEYVPIIALQRLRAAIDPASLRGTVIMVHVGNMPSFLGRTIYYSPADGKNLNRVFPGKADGTLSERIADVMTREIIDKATHVVDLHCGDGNESLRPYTYWITTGDPKVADASRAMALAFGLERIVVDGSRPTDPHASVYLSNTAVTRGKAAITTETGGMGVVDLESVGMVERGVAGLMRHLGMRDDGPALVRSPILIERNEVLRSGSTGIFYPAVAKAQTVAQGALIGHVADFHGTKLEEIRAPFGGEILYVIGTPPISKGEPVAMIGAAK